MSFKFKPGDLVDYDTQWSGSICMVIANRVDEEAGPMCFVFNLEIEEFYWATEDQFIELLERND